MNSQEQSINLLRTHSVLSGEEAVLLVRMKTAAIILTAVILLSGVFVGMAYLAAKIRLDNANADKSNILKLLSFNSRKEALLVALKKRIPLIDMTIRSQYPWDKVTDTVTQIVSPPRLKSISISTENVLTLGVEVGSLEEMNDIVQKTEDLVKSNKIKNPRIESFDGQKTGIISADVIFTPVL